MNFLLLDCSGVADGLDWVQICRVDGPHCSVSSDDTRCIKSWLHERVLNLSDRRATSQIQYFKNSTMHPESGHFVPFMNTVEGFAEHINASFVAVKMRL